MTKTQQKQVTLPGNPKLPSSKETFAELAALEKDTYKYSVSDFFAKPQQSSFRLSPNGRYFSYQQKDGAGKNHVYVKDLNTGAVNMVIEEKEELIKGHFWANDNRLLYIQDEGGNENFHLFGINIDGSNLKALTPFENARISLEIELLKEDPDHIILSINKENAQIYEPFKLNINTGELVKLFENKDVTAPISGFDFDKDGNLRAYVQQEDMIYYVLYYRTSNDAPFERILRTSWDEHFHILAFDYASDNPHAAFVVSNLESNTDEIIRYDLKEKKVLEKLYNHETFDVQRIRTSRKRAYEVDFYSYTGAKKQQVPISEAYKKLHEKFETAFAGKEYSITSVTEEENKYLLYVQSDKLYGSYYVYDVAKEAFEKLLDLMPQLKEEDMAEMRPIQFESRDGMTLHGYITLPQKAANGEKVPLIVNPHGGPHGVRDNWGFNPETQLFASRGYATLQVNFRGSGGYGKELFLAAAKQIGRKMLEDLEDGLAYTIEQGWIDKEKVAIYGASYGGLATLGSLVKTPDLYVCGIDYVGVSNLFTFVDSFPDYWKPYMHQFYQLWYDPNNPAEKQLMTETSPALNVEKITKPLFIIQGANDPRVNIHESDQMVSNLRNRGIDVPYMVKYNEGHGFFHENNKIELYETMMGFWAKHLK
ncbi:MAG: prolyl oligopeptidase family serine peptidase [Chitinophagales bacterium]